MSLRKHTNSFMRDNEEENPFSPDSTSGAGKKIAYFFIGLIVFGVGAFLIFQNTIISTNFSLMDLFGFNPPFGLVILPLLIGIGTLFFNKKSIIGWLVTIFGVIIILLGILMGLRVYFKPVTLFQGILMYGMTAAGLGLITKAFIGRK